MVTEKAVSEAYVSREDVERIETEVEEEGKTEFPHSVVVMNQDDENPD